MTSRAIKILSYVLKKTKKEQTHVIPSGDRRTFDPSTPPLNITNTEQLATLSPKEAEAILKIQQAQAELQQKKNEAEYKEKLKTNGSFFPIKNSKKNSKEPSSTYYHNLEDIKYHSNLRRRVQKAINEGRNNSEVRALKKELAEKDQREIPDIFASRPAGEDELYVNIKEMRELVESMKKKKKKHHHQSYQNLKKI
jgi:hypothetical protein